MRYRSKLTGFVSVLLISIMIIDSKTAFEGAASGMKLCTTAIIPSLFPFLFLCSILTESLWGCHIPGTNYLSRLLHIPQGAESLLISGFMGGYPAGAQIIGEAYRKNRLSKVKSEELLSFCSNAGPAFIFGIAASQFPSPGPVWGLWLIQILSSLYTGLIFSSSVQEQLELSHRHTTIPEILYQTVKSMAVICSWILLFQIITAFLEKWILWCFSPELGVLIKGLLELSSGCCILPVIEHPALRFIICSVILSFGGLCVIMQTASVTGTLSLWAYIRGKLVQCSFSLVLSVLFVLSSYAAVIIIFLSAWLIFIFTKKDVDFQRNTVYNTDIKSRRYLHVISQKN